MGRRVSASQLKSMIRQAEAKQKKAIDDYNRAVRKHNREVNRAIENYNRAVRSHNAKVRANRQRLRTELARLKSGATRSTPIRSSSYVLYETFTRVELRVEASRPSEWQDRFLDLSERETANSVAVVNALNGLATADDQEEFARLTDTVITDELRVVSPDLDERWRGALFAMDPRNPDAARHFCTSAREVFTRFLELHAPDADVLSAFPTCDRAPDGRPTRRTRIRLLLTRHGMAAAEYEDFVDQDVENILDLFHVLNDGTHGSAGRYSLTQLGAVKRRVEHGVVFLANLVS